MPFTLLGFVKVGPSGGLGAGGFSATTGLTGVSTGVEDVEAPATGALPQDATRGTMRRGTR